MTIYLNISEYSGPVEKERLPEKRKEHHSNRIQNLISAFQNFENLKQVQVDVKQAFQAVSSLFSGGNFYRSFFLQHVLCLYNVPLVVIDHYSKGVAKF